MTSIFHILLTFYRLNELLIIKITGRMMDNENNHQWHHSRPLFETGYYPPSASSVIVCFMESINYCIVKEMAPCFQIYDWRSSEFFGHNVCEFSLFNHFVLD